MSVPTSKQGEPEWYACQHEHVFNWGSEPWHTEASQEGTVDEEHPAGIPAMCPEEWPDCPYARRVGIVGHPCLDSSILHGPHPTAEAALKSVGPYKAKWWFPVGTPTFDPQEART